MKTIRTPKPMPTVRRFRSLASIKHAFGLALVMAYPPLVGSVPLAAITTRPVATRYEADGHTKNNVVVKAGSYTIPPVKRVQ